MKEMLAKAYAMSHDDPPRKAIIAHFQYLLGVEERCQEVLLNNVILEYAIKEFLQTHAPDFELGADKEIHRKKAPGGPSGSTIHGKP